MCGEDILKFLSITFLRVLVAQFSSTFDNEPCAARLFCAAVCACRVRNDMKSPFLNHRYWSTQLCLSAAFCVAVCQAQTATPGVEASAVELAKRLEQQGVSL